MLIGGIGLEELLVGLLLLGLTATTYGCVGLFWSARLRTTRGAMLFSYVTTLLGVGGLPLILILLAISSGAFRARLDEVIWPLEWLMNGSRVSLNRFGGSSAIAEHEALLQTQAVIGELLVASNPLLTGITSAAGLVQGRPVVAMERIDTLDVPYVAPWLLFSVLHLLGDDRADLAHFSLPAPRQDVVYLQIALVKDADGFALAARDRAGAASSTTTWRPRTSRKAARARPSRAARSPASAPRWPGSMRTRSSSWRSTRWSGRADSSGEPFEAKQCVLDLRGEDVDAPHDQHVVRAAEDLADPRAGPTARARLAGQVGPIPGTVAQGQRLGGRREHQLADLAVRQAHARLRVHDLGDVVILPDVQLAPVATVGGDAWPITSERPYCS